MMMMAKATRREGNVLQLLSFLPFIVGTFDLAFVATFPIIWS